MELQQTKPRWIKPPAAQASLVPGIRGQSHDSSIRIGLNRQSLGGPRIGGPPVAQASIDEASMDKPATAEATIYNATMAKAAADQTATVQGYAAPKLSQRPKPQKPKTRRDSRCGPSLNRPTPDGCIPPAIVRRRFPSIETLRPHHVRATTKSILMRHPRDRDHFARAAK